MIIIINIKKILKYTVNIVDKKTSCLVKNLTKNGDT